MSDLKQCPCGAAPTKLAIVEGSTFRWRVVSGGCCGDWEVECRVPTVGPEANEEGALAACVREWNAMPRGWEAHIAELERKLDECKQVSTAHCLQAGKWRIENQRLREALKPFSHQDLRQRHPGAKRPDSIIWGRNDAVITLGDFDRAAALLGGGE